MGGVGTSRTARLNMKGFALLVLGFGLCKASEWGYEGPNYWPVIYPKCNGIMQSPINIDNDHCQDNYFFSDAEQTYMVWENHQYDVTGTWSHTGYTIEWKQTKGYSLPSVQGGILQSQLYPSNPKYYLDSLHLSWGAENCRGSQHTIDGKAFPGEIEMVYRNKLDDTIDQAKTMYNGLLVISIFLQVGTENNTDIEYIFEAADVLVNSSLTHDASLEFDPSMLNMLKIGRGFYYYDGSLMTPGCEEDVQRMVWEQAIEISQYQLDRLRALTYWDGTQMVDNFRPPQPINNRVVHRIWA